MFQPGSVKTGVAPAMLTLELALQNSDKSWGLPEEILKSGL
jgi:hypothetical protein